MDKFRGAIKIAGSGRSHLLRERATPARIGNVLALVTVTVTSCISAVAAGKLRDNSDIGIHPAYDEAPSISKDRLSNVFESRWPASTHDFTIGVDGVLRPESGIAGRLNSDSSYAKMDQRRVGTGPARILSQDDIATTGAEGSNADQCGPSQASREAVKALVDAAATRHGVDVTFAEAVAWSESGFDRSRNSPKGARGAMQLMPATAVELSVQDVCDPADNIDGGVRHLRALLDEFGNPLLAVAAYNAGAEAIYRYGGIPPYPETVRFVARVVNFTLGLGPPHGRARVKRGQANETAEDAEVGVITARKRGAFVGGVMQF